MPAVIICPNFSQQDILDLFDRLLPLDYLGPMKNDSGPGYEFLQAVAKMTERESIAVARVECGLLFLGAEGGAKATGTVEFYRETATAMILLSKTSNAGTTATVISDAELAATPGALVGRLLRFRSGPARGQTRAVTANTATTITVSPAFAPAPTAAGGDDYTVELSGLTAKTGTVVTTSNGGRDFLTTQDVLLTNIQTLLSAVLSDVAVTATVYDTTGFPASGTLLVEGEEITYTGTTATTFTGLVRGTNGTTAAAHAIDVEVHQKSNLVVSAPVQAIAEGWEWNVPGVVTTAAGELLPGDIDIVEKLIQVDSLFPTVATFYDATIQVRNIAAMSGGKAGMLDQLGFDRGLPRRFGESDDAYRFRVRALPDTVSPDAIQRTVKDILTPYGASADFEFIETFDPNYQMCWDAPSPNAGTPTFDPSADLALSEVFVYDDTRPASPFMNRWLDEIEMRGAFIVVLPNLATLLDQGMTWGDTAVTAGDHDAAATGGKRAFSAWGIPSTGISPLITPSFWGAGDAKKEALYVSIFDILQAIKAAGVAAIIELEGN